MFFLIYRFYTFVYIQCCLPPCKTRFQAFCFRIVHILSACSVCKKRVGKFAPHRLDNFSRTQEIKKTLSVHCRQCGILWEVDAWIHLLFSNWFFQLLVYLHFPLRGGGRRQKGKNQVAIAQTLCLSFSFGVSFISVNRQMQKRQLWKLRKRGLPLPNPKNRWRCPVFAALFLPDKC